MESIPVWVYIILALFAGLFGNQFLGRYVEQRLKHVQTREQAVQAQNAERERSERQQQDDLLRAVIEMVQTQSKDLTELLKDSLKSNQVMANNIGQLAMAIEGQGRDGQNQFLLVKQALDGIRAELEEMSGKLDTTNDYTAAVIRAIGGNLESLVTDVRKGRDAEKALHKGEK